MASKDSITDLKKLRDEFPALNQKINGSPLAYFDSAATTLKPKVVVDRVEHFLSFETANVHRGAHYLSDQATGFFEETREKAKEFIGASDKNSIVFVKGTTDGINLVASSFGEKAISKNDVILLTQLEHHSNIVPWQELAKRKDARVLFAKINGSGEIDLDSFANLLESNPVKIAAFTACSNSLGTTPPIRKMIELCRQAGVTTLVDGAQAVSSQKIDVQDLNCDFFVFSGHKIFAPYGIGVLYGKLELLNSMDPYQFGGSQIREVTEEKSTFLDSPQKFEAGTPNIEGVIGLGTAIDFLSQLPIAAIREHEETLWRSARQVLSAWKNIEIYGPESFQGPILSFNIRDVHASDIGAIVDNMGVAMRCGHHCTQPLMRALKVPATARISFSIYNNNADILQFKEALSKAQEMICGNTLC